MEKQFLSYFVSMHLFLNNRMVYKKERKQFVIWPGVLLAPGGRVDNYDLSRNHVGKLEGAICCQ